MTRFDVRDGTYNRLHALEQERLHDWIIGAVGLRLHDVVAVRCVGRLVFALCNLRDADDRLRTVGTGDRRRVATTWRVRWASRPCPVVGP